MTAAGLVPGVALVTGAAKRIGRALALELGRRGWAVAVHCNGSVADAQAVAREIGRAEVFPADLSVEAEADALLPRVAATLGPVTCLVNNASVFERDEVATVTRATWDLHMELNLRAPFVLSQAFARDLPAGAEGLIVNLLDQRVWALTAHFTSYTVSKLGLWTLTQTLAKALAPRIRVVGLGPGPTLASTLQTAEQFRRQTASLPLGHGALPEEIARALGFFLDAPSVTGQMIALDGGQHLGWAFPGRPAAED